MIKKCTTVGTTTDANGRYSLQIPSNVNVLVFQYTGLAMQEIEINGRTTIDVVMETGDQTLEAVVVTGYGSARKVGTVIGSVQQVTSKKLEARPSANVLDALQGQVAGLSVLSSSGEPSATQSVRLHGIGSLGASSTPLYILDGQPISAGTIVSLNPNDFESITVLKDASATSIYGSRAANGVIVITSKRGQANMDARVTLRSQYGISALANPSFYDKMMTTDQLLNFWEATGIRTPDQVAAIRGTYGMNDTRWIDVYMRNNVPTYQTDLSVQGGGGKTTYFISGSQFFQEGTATGSKYDRYTLRANVESKAKNWLTVGTNLFLGRDTRVGNSNYGSNSTNGGLSFLRQPYYTPVDSAGNRYDYIPGGSFYHPEYLAEKIEDRYTNSQLNASVYLEIEPIKNLKIRSRANAEAYDYARDYLKKPSYLGSLNNGQRLIGNTQGITNSMANSIEYAFNINKDHQLSLLGGHEGIRYVEKYFAATSTGQSDDRLVHLNNGNPTTYSMTSSSTEYAYLSFFGRAEYSFQDRFYVDALLRRDASSRFGKENRWATFWALGGMWNIKRETFLQNITWLTSANVKVSYGTQGNSAIGNYTALATVGSTSNYGNLAGWGISNPGNSALTWETQEKLTTGFKAELFGRYRIEIEYYNRQTSNMLMSVPVPFTTGFTELYQNIGTLVNNGLDFNFGVDILKGKDHYLTATISMNYNKEKVSELFYGLDRFELANTGITYVVGSPIMFYYPLYAGINPANGKQQWYLPGENVDKPNRDKNNVTEDSDLAQELYQNTGKKRYAPFNGGLSISGGWRGFSIQADFAFVLGKSLISNDRFFSENPNAFPAYNASSRVLDYWTPENPNALYPDWSGGQKMIFDDHLLENASFLRMKNLSIAYSLPKAWLNKTKTFNAVRVFASGRNLLTFTKFKGIDPEPDTNLSLGAYANSKQYSIGLELTF